MYYTFSKTQGNDYVLIELNNVVLHDLLAKKMWVQLFNVSEKTNSNKCIIDMQDSVFGEKIEGVFRLTNYIDSIGFDKKYQFALVSKLKTEGLQILEILLKKKGYCFKLFRLMDDAKQWIVQNEMAIKQCC